MKFEERICFFRMYPPSESITSYNAAIILKPQGGTQQSIVYTQRIVWQ